MANHNQTKPERRMMYIVPREDIVLDGDGFLIPCERLDLRDGIIRDGYLLPSTKPLKVIHYDDSGHILALLNEHDDDSLIIVQSIDFVEVEK